LIGQAELQGEYLLARRPHFQLVGRDLVWIGSTQAHRRFSEAEADLWNLLQQPASLTSIREKFGDRVDTLIREFLKSELCDLLEPAFSDDRRRVLVIEPHADDAALSIGGTMWDLRHECEFVIATMASRSNHTRYRDLGCDFFDVEDVSRIRRLESELFARLVGGSHVAVGLTDSELRYRDANWTFDFFKRHRMSIRVSASRIADAEERKRWTDAVLRLLADHQSAEVWFPLGGPHTDHLLTVDACFAAFLANPALVRGRVLRIYGEVPYTARYPQQMRTSFNALIDSGALLDEIRAPIDDAQEQKRRLASIYDSQDVKGMLGYLDSSKPSRGSGAGRTETMWTLRGLPSKADAAGIVSTATVEPAHVAAAAAWATRNRDAPNLRVLLLMPTGQWARDLDMLFTAFPRARFEVLVATTAAAEVINLESDRVAVRIVASGPIPWIVQSLGLSFGMKAWPTLFHVGERRRWQARLLSRLWPGSDTLIVESMNQMVNALRVNA
jgi:LmbE family N-acetylglucosaminyl deacetylase